MKCAIYARVSTEGRGQDAENQLAQLRQFAAAMTWEITAEYVDNVSASGRKERPAFVRLFEAASKRKFDIVLFWSLDRFSREGVRETLNHLTRLDGWGVGFRSYSEQYLDSTGIFKDAVIAILAAIAKQERIRISERTKAGLDRVRAGGTILGRRAVVVDVDSACRLLDEGASYRKVANQMGLKLAVLHRALNRPIDFAAHGAMLALQAEGKTTDAIADELNTRGLTRPDEAWTGPTVANILRREKGQMSVTELREALRPYGTPYRLTMTRSQLQHAWDTIRANEAEHGSADRPLLPVIWPQQPK